MSLSSTSKASVVLLGCLNPPTIAHLRLLIEAKEHLERTGHVVAEAVLSPCSDGYVKPTLIPSKHRLEMCQRAVDEINAMDGRPSPPVFRVSSREASTPEFTDSDTVLSWIQSEAAALHQTDIRTYLVCGGDLFASLTRPDLWPPKVVEGILSHHSLLVSPRPFTMAYGLAVGDADACRLVTQQAPLLSRFAHRIDYLEANLLDISSTKVRSAILNQQSIHFLVPQSVATYIKENQLYLKS